MLATWPIDHLVCGNYVGLPNGPVFYVITLDQHVIHRRTRVINQGDVSCCYSEYHAGWQLPADLCLVCLLCFRSTCNGIERSSPSHHTTNLVYIYIYIYIYIYNGMT